MSRTIELRLEDLIPAREDVFKSQGIPAGTPVSEMIKSIFELAIQSFRDTAKGIFIVSDISSEEFGHILYGEGKNASDSVVGEIYREAEALSVYVLTMGKEISDEISRLFDAGEFPLAVMLDSVASNAAHNGSLFVEKWFRESLNLDDKDVHNKVALTYSPGYCGWHISGQRKLFHFLQPERIGITLNESYLMTPLKSISGALIYGKKDIHLHKIDYSYCMGCKSKSCLDRMRDLKIRIADKNVSAPLDNI